eukprot:9516727-Alexandrium_andersonii.AAC.1
MHAIHKCLSTQWGVICFAFQTAVPAAPASDSHAIGLNLLPARTERPSSKTASPKAPRPSLDSLIKLHSR